MAKITRPLTLKYQTTVDGDIGEIQLSAGSEVTVLQRWPKRVLIKDADGHLHTVPADAVD